jgi:glycosyltransferase involved in cell wall biosynthesis
MSKQPLVSVIVPVYNGVDYLEEAVKSVLSQTYTDVELILVDDCSTDDSRDLIQQLASTDPRVQYQFAAENGGPARSRNIGMAKASGGLIAFLDADDVWLPKKLEIQVQAFAESEEIGLICTNTRLLIDGAAEPHGQLKEKEICNGNVSLKTYVLDGVPIATSSVMIRKECIETCGEFQDSYRIIDDYVMWLRICQRYHIRILRDPLVLYRVHGNNISKDRLVCREEKLAVFEAEILSNKELTESLGQEFLILVQKKYCALGRSYAKKGRIPEARAAYDKALTYKVGLGLTLKAWFYRLLAR